MAIIEHNTTESKSGFEKQLEASALTMMFDNVQVFMYQKPVQSTVRESVSNALDSVKEKNVAVNIISGKNKISDYYVEREGAIYEDSKFDKDYYNLEWLSGEDKVTLTYINNPDALSRDTFVIEDTGVGLGGIRLEKYFALGYSSKRLSSETLGKFGLGNKSPLSTGVESYRIISHYNGKEFAFDVYSHKVDCVYSKWGDDGSVNEYYEFKTVKSSEGEAFKAFYKPTTKKNSLRIEIDVKKHNKHQYLEAVKSQLMYFKEDITFIEMRDGQAINIPFKSKIVYENDDVILSDSNYFTRPHFVLKGVTYGAIDFRELEMDNRFGSVGIKLNMEEIDVSPSRESIIYNTRTREAVTAKYNKVSSAVTGMISSSMKSEDFLEWARACNAIFYSNGSISSGSADKATADVLYRLSGLIDKNTLDLKHPTKGIAYFADITQFMPKGLRVEEVTPGQKWNSAKRTYTNTIQRSNANNSASLNRYVYLQFAGGNTKTTKFLLQKHPQGFTIVKPEMKEAELDELLKQYVYDKMTITDINMQAVKFISSSSSDATKNNDYLVAFKKVTAMVENLKTSSQIGIYDESIVPDTFKWVEDDDLEDIDLTKAEKEDYKKLVKKRKADGKFILGRCSNRTSSMTNKTVYSNIEIDSATLANENFVYGFGTDLSKLTLLSQLINKKYGSTTDHNGNYIYGWSNDLKVGKIAQSNKKFVADKVYIDDYFMENRNGVLTTGDLLKEYFTTKYIQENLDKSEYLTNFSLFDKELCEEYTKLYAKARSYSLYSLPNGYPVINTLKKAVEFELFKLEHPDADEDLLDMKGVELLGADLIDDITDIDILEKDIYDKVNWINKFTEVYGEILGQLDCLNNKGSKISESLEKDIKFIIESKRDQLELDYPNLNT